MLTDKERESIILAWQWDNPLFIAGWILGTAVMASQLELWGYLDPDENLKERLTRRMQEEYPMHKMHARLVVEQVYGKKKERWQP